MDYKDGSFVISSKSNHQSTKHDFSGTNFVSKTRGWLAQIKKKNQNDNKFFLTVHELAFEKLDIKGKQRHMKINDFVNEYSDADVGARMDLESEEDDDSEKESGNPENPENDFKENDLEKETLNNLEENNLEMENDHLEMSNDVREENDSETENSDFKLKGKSRLNGENPDGGACVDSENRRLVETLSDTSRDLTEEP